MRKKIRTLLLNFSKKSILFRRILRKILYYKNKIIFSYQLLYKVEDLIVFESYAGSGYNCSPRAIYEEMLEDKRFENYKFVWFFKEPEKFKDLVKQDKRTQVYKYRSKQYHINYGKARYFITNFSLPEYLYKKKNQIYVQCWHGSPLKSLGLDIINNTKSALNSKKEIEKRYKRYSKKIDYFLAQSDFSALVHSSGFGFTEQTKVITEGYPRNVDLYKYTEKDIKIIKKNLNINETKKVILYVPTYRDNEHKSELGYVYDLNIDFDLLKEKYEKDYIILFRTHYLVANSFNFDKYKNFVYDVSKENNINDLFIISDLMITDYSSCFHDYSNLLKPMIFYMYDLEDYQNETRGLSFPLNELPGEIVKDNSELIKILDDLENYKKESEIKLLEFRKKYVYLDDANTAKRVIDRIFGLK